MKPILLQRVAAACLVGAAAAATQAQFDPAKVVREPEAIAKRYPDPALSYATPGFKAGRADFPSHAEVLAFLDELARSSPRVKVEEAGRSQRGLVLPLVILSASGQPDPALPSVLILGQQHGNEPSGGEAALVLAQQLAGPRAALLDKVNVLIVPRANPDGGDRFVRTTASGIDVNRDHLLLQTPEGRALAALTLKYKPQVVLDLHEFTLAGRWVDKFGAMLKYDALLQPAGVGNLDPHIAAAAQADYIERMQAALAAQGLSSFAYHTTSSDPKDKVVSMGGVQPDTGRNVGGLRPAISMLIEVRGVGIGRAHFLRRVHTQALAAMTVVETAAAQGPRLLALVRQAEADAQAQACRGELVVEARHTPGRQKMVMLDAASGADLPMEVDWRAAEPLQVVRSRPRPCGYLLAAAQAGTLERLRLLGVRLQTVAQASRWQVERYRVTAQDDGKRQDARGAIEDGAPIRVLAVETEAGSDVVGPGAVYVSMAQPLAPMIAAALEPDSQNSYAANRLLEPAQLRRVMTPPQPAWFKP
ncbi:MAG TPA: M14 family metallocarboxypeptidase [Ideonella sp.]|nr:M14 family metallocarboxypeptidase [Ideonella sp.]